MPDIYQKSGYLNSPFRLFYLEDLPGREYTYHYHDFHKLLIFLNLRHLKVCRIFLLQVQMKYL